MFITGVISQPADGCMRFHSNLYRRAARNLCNNTYSREVWIEKNGIGNHVFITMVLHLVFLKFLILSQEKSASDFKKE